MQAAVSSLHPPSCLFDGLQPTSHQHLMTSGRPVLAALLPMDPSFDTTSALRGFKMGAELPTGMHQSIGLLLVPEAKPSRLSSSGPSSRYVQQWKQETGVETLAALPLPPPPLFSFSFQRQCI